MIEQLRDLLFPRFATRKERRLNIAMQAAHACVIVCIAGIAVRLPNLQVPLIGLVTSIMFALALRRALESAHHRALSRLRDAQFLICPQCLYDLHSSIKAGQCPECGEQFELRTLRHDWTHRYVRLLNRVVTGDDDDRHPSDGVDWWS